jgi:response regulator RpfG family c-di-GMP phosphodiesterase
MARSVSVKIPTSVVIEMVETKLAEMNKAEKDYPILLATYNKDIKTYGKAVAELIGKNANKVVSYDEFKFDSDNFSVTNDYRNIVQVQLGKALSAKVGDKPERPQEVGGWQFNNKKEELAKTLRLLKLTEQETITSSTYNSVLDLL